MHQIIIHDIVNTTSLFSLHHICLIDQKHDSIFSTLTCAELFRFATVIPHDREKFSNNL